MSFTKARAAQGSSRIHQNTTIYSCAPIGKKRLLRCLCSCMLCEGMHAQVTSQRDSGAPGKTGSLTLVEVPVGTLHTADERDRSFSKLSFLPKRGTWAKSDKESS